LGFHHTRSRPRLPQPDSQVLLDALNLGRRLYRIAIGKQRWDMAKPTTTRNRLHFSDLNPIRFEDLSHAMVYRIHKWDTINHDGRTGTDKGSDIRATRIAETGEIENWAIQCKRYNKFTASQAKKLVGEIV
jgi:hypothetical protein